MIVDAPRALIVIGASAGGVSALQPFLAELPATLDASVLIVVHRAPSTRSELAQVLGRRALLEVIEPYDEQVIAPNCVYLAPADQHMRVAGRRIRLDRGPKEHHTRPAVDPLFMSAAETHGSGVIGILMSGNLNDGVVGMIAIRKRGGLTLVQDPAEATFPGMPENALLYDQVDLAAPTRQLAMILPLLVKGRSVKDALDTLR